MSLKYLIVATFPILTWSYYIYIWNKIKKREKEKSIYHKKNNCVITYANNREIWGWIQPNPTIKSIGILTNHLDPIIDFINTTEKTLDVAVMTFTIKILIEALNKLKLRGVKVRIIVDSFNQTEAIKAAVTEFKWNNKFESLDNSIFHHKYLVRDHGHDKSAVLNGSLNFTMQGIFNNYEDIVITTDKQVVDAMQCNFNELWEYFSTK